MNTRTLLRLGASMLAGATALTGCAGAPAVPAAAAKASTVVSVSDVWVKAAGTGMTGAFGTIANSGSADVTLVAAASPASRRAELHETTASSSGQSAMRAKEGGFTLPAGSSFVLEPGANHIMLMDLTGPLKAGDHVALTLTFSDQSTLNVTASVKDFAGANEKYASSSASATGMGH